MHMFDRSFQRNLLQLNKLCLGRYGNFGQPAVVGSDIWGGLLVFFTYYLKVLFRKNIKLKF